MKLPVQEMTTDSGTVIINNEALKDPETYDLIKTEVEKMVGL